MLFLTRIALWKYRVQLPGFELPNPVATAQQEFDDRLAKVLDGMADRVEGRATDGTKNFRSSVGSLDRAIQSYYPRMSNEVVTAQFGAFLSLSHRIEDLTLSLDMEMAAAGGG